MNNKEANNMSKKYYYSIGSIAYEFNDFEITCTKDWIYYNLYSEPVNDTFYILQFVFEKGDSKEYTVTLGKYWNIYQDNYEFEWNDIETFATPKEAETLKNHVKNHGVYYGGWF